jgi:hypothetical protein
MKKKKRKKDEKEGKKKSSMPSSIALSFIAKNNLDSTSLF